MIIIYIFNNKLESRLMVFGQIKDVLFSYVEYCTLVMSLCLSLRWTLGSFGGISVIDFGHAHRTPPSLSHSHQSGYCENFGNREHQNLLETQLSISPFM